MMENSRERNKPSSWKRYESEEVGEQTGTTLGTID
jgi:hypothetical protein